MFHSALDFCVVFIRDYPVKSCSERQSLARSAVDSVMLQQHLPIQYIQWSGLVKYYLAPLWLGKTHDSFRQQNNFRDFTLQQRPKKSKSLTWRVSLHTYAICFSFNGPVTAKDSLINSSHTQGQGEEERACRHISKNRVHRVYFHICFTVSMSQN